jgi:hypothetical protein
MLTQTEITSPSRLYARISRPELEKEVINYYL